MIGPGGLLLVISHIFAVPVSVLWVGLQQSSQLNLDVKNIFAGSHTDLTSMAVRVLLITKRVHFVFPHFLYNTAFLPWSDGLSKEKFHFIYLILWLFLKGFSLTGQKCCSFFWSYITAIFQNVSNPFQGIQVSSQMIVGACDNFFVVCLSATSLFLNIKNKWIKEVGICTCLVPHPLILGWSSFSQLAPRSHLIASLDTLLLACVRKC